MNYIGVDLGTSAVKLLLMDEAGKVLKIASKEYPLYMGDSGWSEQEPEDWWNATVEGIKELISGTEADCVKAVSFSGQMHGLVLLDENDAVIRRAILWNDQRTQPQCDSLNNGVGRSKLIDDTANVALTGFTAPKILWVKENEPENFRKISKIMLPKDYIAYKLSGVHATDYSDASGMLLLDVKNKCWSQNMIDICGIKKEQLAALNESFAPVGTVLPEVSLLTGLCTKTKIVIGGGDQAVGAVGTGTVKNNMCSVSLGTSGVVFVASNDFKVDYGRSALHSFCHANGSYHMMGVTLAAAASYKWWMEEILRTEDHASEQAGVGDINNKVYFLPYMSGERTPHNDPNAKGAFVGMSMTTTRQNMTQAVMEGVAFSLRDTLEVVRALGVDVKTARITGGGAKSGAWCQMIADVFNVTVEKINSQEGPALGAAVLAAVGDGAYASVADATEAIIKVTESYTPNPAAAEAYNGKYKIFAKLYTDLKDTFERM